MPGLQVECGLRAAAEKELSTRQHEHDELAQRSSELAEQVAQQAGVITALQAENQSLSTDLESSRAQGRQLAEDKARLEVRLGLRRGVVAAQCKSTGMGSCLGFAPAPPVVPMPLCPALP